MALYLIKNIKQKNKNKNDDKEILLTKNVFYKKNIFNKGIGLMFHKKIKNEAHYFCFKKPRRQSLTMLFVFFPIDVIFLNNKKIVEIKKKFLPFTNYMAKEKADAFIELPKGFIDAKKIKLGDKIVIKN